MKWIDRDTAVLVVHGIGSQLPLQTLDEFCRTLLTACEANRNDFTVSHELTRKPYTTGEAGVWYENFIRIRKNGSPCHLDVYEYYWANFTEDKTNLDDIGRWLGKVARGAASFYKDNADIGAKYRDQSPFFTPDGKFRYGLYRFFLLLFCGIIPAFKLLWNWLSRKLFNLLPDIPADLSNIIGDVTVYNTIDPKNTSFEVRKTIMNGALQSLIYLLGREDNGEKLRYGRVIVAGHSLGTQIAFDAINRLNLLVTQGDLAGYDTKGDYTCPGGQRGNISHVLCGLVTFGSPLDKIAFFLREQCGADAYLRAQIVANYHSFKQKNLLTAGERKFDLPSPFPRVFDRIRWYNYYDNHDYVSGHLDYYCNVKNINSLFGEKEIVPGVKKYRFDDPAANYDINDLSFTHGWYWKDLRMFRDIVEKFITADGLVEHEEESK